MLFQRSSLCHDAPEEHDALEPREREVLELWDGGATFAEIAALLRMKPERVEYIVCLYDDRPDEDEPCSKAKMRRGSEMLRVRILQFHPHVAFGGES